MLIVSEDFNLAVWRIAKHPPNLIIKHDVIRNTHAHTYSSYVREGAPWPTTALLRITATAFGSSLFLLSRTQFNSSPSVGCQYFC